MERVLTTHPHIHVKTDEMARSDMGDAKIPQYVDRVIGVKEGTL